MTRSRPFTWLAAALFALAALVHIYRLFTHFQIIIGSHSIPDWGSYVGIVVGAFLVWMLWAEARGVVWGGWREVWRGPGAEGDDRPLDVEAEQHHVAVLDDIILAFRAELP